MKKPKQPRPPKLTDAERHKRFVETAKKVDASENIADFERAFDRIIKAKPSGSRLHPSDKRSA
jgi:hypothetical protein